MTTAIERLRDAYHAGVLTGREVGAVEREAKALRADRDRLAAALVDTINAIGNGSAATSGCSTDFLVYAPDEVRAAMARVREERDRLAARVAELEAERDDWRASALRTRAECDRLEGLAEPAEADPCPVDEGILAAWAHGEPAGVYREMADERREMRRALAWLVRRAEGRR